MFFDSLTAAAMADELRNRVLGGRVQRAVMVNQWSLGLEIYSDQRYQLLASSNPRHPRLYLVDFKLRRGVEGTSPILLLVRKHLIGARLVRIEHPEMERVLHLVFAGPEGETLMIQELIDRRANTILVQSGRVLEALQRVGPELNRFRTVLPGQPYCPPPPQNKLDPTDVTELRIRRMLEAAEPGQPAWRMLVDNVAGVSPLFAREVIFQASGNATTLVGDCTRIGPLLDAFQEGLIPYWEHEWQPSIVLDDTGVVTAFAPYPLSHLGDPVLIPSISEALGRYYGLLLGADPYQTAKKPLEEAVDRARRRLARKRASLVRQAPAQEVLEEQRQKGELILAYSSQITPGQQEFRAQYTPEGPMLVIRLDPKLTPVVNAQRYFRAYEKSKRAVADVPKRLRATDLEISYLEQLATDLELATNWPEIDQVREALSAAKLLRGPPSTRPQGAASGPLRVVSDDGLIILVGRNSHHNEEITFRRAAPDDLWLHARGVPGGHVLIKSGGRPVPERSVHLAAQLAAGHSAARFETNVAVDIVVRKRVKRVGGNRGTPGMVTYRGEETIRVTPKRSTE